MDKLCKFLTAIIIIAGCSSNETASLTADKEGELSTVNLTVDNLQRSFLLYKPKGYNNAGKMPVLLVNHGGQSTSQGMMAVADFRNLADNEKFLLLYPQGYLNTWNDGRPTAANLSGVDDVNYFRQLCNYAVANLDADPSRIYVTGLSSGGFMASRLGCELSDRIAAIAVVGATLEQGVFNNYSPGRYVPAMIIQGTADPFVPINGGIVLPGAGGYAMSHSAAVSKWISINNCSSSPVVTNIPDTANDGTTIDKNVYSNAGNTSEVVGYVVNNGGHTWPQGLQYQSVSVIGRTTQNLNANSVIWAFCKRWRRN
ncbi:hypothetical protein CHU92_03310 [Flavobacterium cyanobacteriorum]|uniref:Esterase n=1 Tax=Flavobacterium cyanobacteriorum TaxID=2022802 RepID=A0A255ZQ05_9FLAO|nr:PHB depolymerase family esterase [Flavobacterium cyanobacteriorum]OYQ43501.1 hypothetical protein CHU92_03310 [Flavobacterium cyanobacteriorum]